MYRNSIILLVLAFAAATAFAQEGRKRTPKQVRDRAVTNVGDMKIRAEREEQVLELLREHAPKMHQHLLGKRDLDPAGYRRMVARIGRMNSHNAPPELQGKKIKAMLLGRETMETSHAYHNAGSDDEQVRISKILRSLVASWFDARQEVREYELAMLQERLKRVEQEVHGRAAMKQQLVNSKFEELTGGTPRPHF